MTTRPGPDDLVGAAEIARLLGGLSRQRVQQLIGTEGFPEAIVRLDMGKVWFRPEVEQWAAENRPATSRQKPKPRASTRGRKGTPTTRPSGSAQ